MKKILMGLASFVILSLTTFASGSTVEYSGNSSDIMLQGFHWDSCNQNNTWYNTVATDSLMNDIAGKFSVVWLPPPGTSCGLSKQTKPGYLPEEWYNLNNYYGNQGDLKTLIAKFHNKEIKVLADIVVNHRNGTIKCPHGRYIYYSNPAMSPNEDLIYGGYDTVSDGKENTCSTCASNKDNVEGNWSANGTTYYNDDYKGAPDLNHGNINTRAKIKDWLNWLKDANNAGFDGWRYDYIRGFSPKYLGEYNANTKPYLAVGEFWKFESDGLPTSSRQAHCDVVNNSGNKTMVFDFPLKKALNSAFGGTTFNGYELSNTGENGSKGLIGWWSEAAVTFVDNHDTGWSPGNSQSHWPLPTPNGDLISVKAAYAYILTHPGIPCVYWADWRDRDGDLKTVIDKLVQVRKMNNVNRGSRVWVDRAENGLYAAFIGNQGNEQVAIKIGNQGWGNYEGWSPAANLGLNKSFTRYYNGGHAFTVFYKN